MSTLSFLVPPLWGIADFRPHRDPQVVLDAFAAQMVRVAQPEEKAWVNRLLEDSLLPQLRRLHAGGVAYVLMPLPMLVIHPVVTVTPWRLPDDADPGAVLYEVVGDDPDAVPVEFDNLVGLRRETSVEAPAPALAAAQAVWAQLGASAPRPRLTDAEFDELLPPEERATLALRSHRVHYCLGDLEAPASWMDIQLVADHPTTQAAQGVVRDVVELFDEIVSTFGVATMTDTEFETATSEELAASLATTLPFWTMVPSIPDPDLRAAWAAEAAPLVLEEREIDPTFAQHMSEALEVVLAAPLEAGCRLLFLVHPTLGAAVWDLVGLDPDPGRTERELTGADDEATLGSQTDAFEWNGISGLQTVRVDAPDDLSATSAEGDEVQLTATAAITLTREIAGRRETLLAQSRTTDLDALAMSTVPMQYLLTTELMEELAEELGAGSNDRPDPANPPE